jgi:hypothetical protein
MLCGELRSGDMNKPRACLVSGFLRMHHPLTLMNKDKKKTEAANGSGLWLGQVSQAICWLALDQSSVGPSKYV